MRAGLWLPWATPAKAPIPSFVNSSGPSASARQVLVLVAISAARSASRSGVRSFAPGSRGRARGSRRRRSSRPPRPRRARRSPPTRTSRSNGPVSLRARSSSAPGRRSREAGRPRPRAPARRCGSESSSSQASVPPTRPVASATAAAAVRTVSASSSSAGPSPTRTTRFEGSLRVEDGRPTGLRPDVSSSATGRRRPCRRPRNALGPTGTRGRRPPETRLRLRPASGRDAIRQGFYFGRRRFTQLSTSLYFLLISPIHTAGMTPLRPPRFRRSRTAKTVESLIDVLSALTAERQVLRASEAGSVKLERNRIAIARGAVGALARADRALLPGRAGGAERGLAGTRFG